MKKSFLLSFAVVALSFLFFGCGGGSNGENTSVSQHVVEDILPENTTSEQVGVETQTPTTITPTKTNAQEKGSGLISFNLDEFYKKNKSSTNDVLFGGKMRSTEILKDRVTEIRCFFQEVNGNGYPLYYNFTAPVVDGKVNVIFSEIMADRRYQVFTYAKDGKNLDRTLFYGETFVDVAPNISTPLKITLSPSDMYQYVFYNLSGVVGTYTQSSSYFVTVNGYNQSGYFQFNMNCTNLGAGDFACDINGSVPMTEYSNISIGITDNSNVPYWFNTSVSISDALVDDNVSLKLTTGSTSVDLGYSLTVDYITGWLNASGEYVEKGLFLSYNWYTDYILPTDKNKNQILVGDILKFTYTYGDNTSTTINTGSCTIQDNSTGVYNCNVEWPEQLMWYWIPKYYTVEVVGHIIN
jgi:hypothetical protein